MKHLKYDFAEGDSLVIPEAESYGDCLDLINSDLYRISGKKKSRIGVLLHLLTHPFRWMSWFRLAKYRGIFQIPCKAMTKICRNLSKVDISNDCKIGYGFYIGHGMCIVVSPHTIIGNNVNLSQFVNIGSNEGKTPMVGDRVYVGPMVCIVEDARIGHGATIGAGAVATKSLPAGSTCVGIPAKPIGYDNSEKYIRNPWIPDYSN